MSQLALRRHQAASPDAADASPAAAASASASASASTSDDSPTVGRLLHNPNSALASIGVLPTPGPARSVSSSLFICAHRRHSQSVCDLSRTLRFARTSTSSLTRLATDLQGPLNPVPCRPRATPARTTARALLPCERPFLPNRLALTPASRRPQRRLAVDPSSIPPFTATPPTRRALIWKVPKGSSCRKFKP